MEYLIGLIFLVFIIVGILSQRSRDQRRNYSRQTDRHQSTGFGGGYVGDGGSGSSIYINDNTDASGSDSCGCDDGGDGGGGDGGGGGGGGD